MAGWLAGLMNAHMSGEVGWVSGWKKERMKVKEPQPWLCKAEGSTKLVTFSHQALAVI